MKNVQIIFLLKLMLVNKKIVLIIFEFSINLSTFKFIRLQNKSNFWTTNNIVTFS